MTASPSRYLAGAETLLAQLEDETARILRLRREAEAADLARGRLEAAVEALLPTLPEAARQAARQRLRDSRRRTDLPAAATAAEGPLADLTALLASWERPVLHVIDAQTFLLDRGRAVTRGYASKALNRLAARGMVQKTAHGRYRVIRTHPELVALRLAALEAELEGL